MRETLNQRGEPARSLLAIPQDAMTSMRGQSGGPPPGTEQNRRRQHVPESGATALFVITWRAHRSKANGDTWSGRRRTRQTFLFFLLLMSRTHACTTLTAIYKLSSGDKSRQAELEQRSFTGNHTHLQKKKVRAQRSTFLFSDHVWWKWKLWELDPREYIASQTPPQIHNKKKKLIWHGRTGAYPPTKILTPLQNRGSNLTFEFFFPRCFQRRYIESRIKYSISIFVL